MINKFSEEKYVTTFLKSLIICFIVGLGFLFYWDALLPKEYPALLNSDSLSDTVVHVEKDRGVARVIFESNKKIRLPRAANYQYVDSERNLTLLISVGDVIFKKKYSDTLLVKHQNRDYIFVAETDIK